MGVLRSQRIRFRNHMRLSVLAIFVMVGAFGLNAQEDRSSKLVLVNLPGASTRMHLPNFFLHALKLGDVARNVSDALTNVGYTDQGWFVIRQSSNSTTQTAPPTDVNGFAVVTRLEQIDDNGKSTIGGTRWTLDVSSSNVGSFLDAVKLFLRGAPNGRYRVFLIWVSNSPVSQMRSSPPLDSWSNFLRDGTKSPWLDVMDAIPVNWVSGGGCSAFVYEYERSAVTGDAQFVTSSTLTAEQHLKAAGIWDALAREGKKSE